MITREELSKELGISRGALSKLEKRGMPIDSIERARRWRKKHLQPGRLKGVRRDTLSTDGANTSASDLLQVDDQEDQNDIDPEDAEIRSFVGARERREHYQAELARMAYQREAGLLMEREKVISMMADTGAIIRHQLEELSQRLAPILAPITDEMKIVGILDDAVFQMLTGMSQKFERLASGLDDARQTEIL